MRISNTLDRLIERSSGAYIKSDFDSLIKQLELFFFTPTKVINGNTDPVRAFYGVMQKLWILITYFKLNPLSNDKYTTLKALKSIYQEQEAFISIKK